MIKKMIAMAILLGASAWVSASTGNISFPDSGVICDKKAGYCADSMGISMGYTEQYLGKKAMEKLNKITRGPDVNLQAFTLSNGAHCDAKEKQCYTDRYYPRTADKRDNKLTQQLYGSRH